MTNSPACEAPTTFSVIALLSVLEDQHQIGEKQEQMHRPQEDVGSLTGERQHADDQRQRQQGRIRCIEAEDDGPVGAESDGEHRRDRQADARQRGPQREIDGAPKVTVSTSVPMGSPSCSARPSAWRTTANAETRIAPKSQPRMQANQTELERSASQRLPNARNIAVVAMLTDSGHSWRRT